MEGRSLAAKLSTETAAAREIILESLPALRGRLVEQGFEVSQFQVEVANNGSDASLGNSSNSNDQRSGSTADAGSRDGYRAHYRTQRQNSVKPAELEPSARPNAGWFSATSIDLQI
jgi:flagellar hook-length control protein FliK